MSDKNAVNRRGRIARSIVARYKDTAQPPNPCRWYASRQNSVHQGSHHPEMDREQTAAEISTCKYMSQKPEIHIIVMNETYNLEKRAKERWVEMPVVDWVSKSTEIINQWAISAMYHFTQIGVPYFEHRVRREFVVRWDGVCWDIVNYHEGAKDCFVLHLIEHPRSNLDDFQQGELRGPQYMNKPTIVR